jgi:DNA-binding GntR family transcriptional regulator
MRKKRSANKELLYLKIAKGIEQQINNGVMKVGDKLPSIRTVCRQHGVSMSTAQFAYYELESKSLVSSRPQSGYYVTSSGRMKLALPEISRPQNKVPGKAGVEIFESMLERLTEKNFTPFSLVFPRVHCCPLQNLKRALYRQRGNCREAERSTSLYKETIN